MGVSVRMEEYKQTVSEYIKKTINHTQMGVIIHTNEVNPCLMVFYSCLSALLCTAYRSQTKCEVGILYTNNERGYNCGMEVEILNDKAKIPNESFCIVCEKPKLDGIHLCMSFLCNECERKITQTSTKDPEYKFYLERLKKVRTELLS